MSLHVSTAFMERFYNTEYSFLCTVVASPINFVTLFFLYMWGFFLHWMIYFNRHIVLQWLRTVCLSARWKCIQSIFLCLHIHIYSMHVCMYVKWMHTESLSASNTVVGCLTRLIFFFLLPCFTLYQLWAFCTPFVKEIQKKISHSNN